MAGIVDLNEAFGKALIEKFFEPIEIGRGVDNQPYYAPSGVAVMAQEIYKQQGQKILEQFWEQIDIEDLATKIANLVVADLVKAPGHYQRNVPQEQLKARILEIVAQQLGQRVVDGMDLQVGPKEIES